MDIKNTFDPITILESEKIAAISEEFANRIQVEGYTIDGETSKDLDDGFSITENTKNYTVQISIADVGHYVKPNTWLYREAFERVDTKYFADNNVPMLPRLLSEKLLSLQQGKKTPTITTEIIIDKKSLEIVKLSIFESLFFNKQRFTYAQISTAVRNNLSLNANILLAYHLANQLYDKRISNNELVVYDSLKLIYTDEEGSFKKLSYDSASEGNFLVQELMILTNKVVSEFLAKQNVPILYRNHLSRTNAPEREDIIDIIKEAGSNKQLLNQLSGKINLWFTKATYSPSLKGHYALNSPAYMHFTSPIRRFADLVSHLQLKAFLRGETNFNNSELQKIANHINTEIELFNQKRVQGFKLKGVNEMQDIMKEASSREYIEASSSSLNMMLKLAFKKEKINPELLDAVRQRIINNEINVNHIFSILFEQKTNKIIWNELIAITWKYIKSNIGIANQIINILVAKEDGLKGISIDIIENNKYFYSRMIAIQNRDILSTTDYYNARTKKEANHKASYYFLKQYFYSRLVDEKNTIPPNTELENPIEDEAVVPNSQAMLNNLFQINPLWSKPQYQFETLNSNPAKSLFSCKICIVYNGNEFVQEEIASTKKQAKNIAANKLHELLVFHNKPMHSQKLINIQDVDKSTVSRFYEYLQLKGISKSCMKITKQKEDFKVIINLLIDNENVMVEGIGPSKKIAKLNATKEFFESLDDTKDSVQKA